MPRDKDFKRIVRSRMKKTGESYTTARVHVLAKANPRQAPQTRPDLAAVAGMADDKVAAKTGRTWHEWVRTLDGAGAGAMPHREIAALVHEKHGIRDWWAQTVTVGYERIKGLRQRGQRRNGSYEATKSRTFDVPVKTLFDAWVDDTIRRGWLGATGIVVRTATAPRSIRLGWPDGTIVAVGFIAKGKSRSVVAVQHAKLPDKAASDRAKQYWTDRLDALGSLFPSERA